MATDARATAESSVLRDGGAIVGASVAAPDEVKALAALQFDFIELLGLSFGLAQAFKAHIGEATRLADRLLVDRDDIPDEEIKTWLVRLRAALFQIDVVSVALVESYRPVVAPAVPEMRM